MSDCNHVGEGTRAFGRPLVHNEGRIEIGRGCVLRSLGAPVRLTTTEAGTITIGDAVVIDMGSRLFSDKQVRIEDGVVIGPNVIVCDKDESGLVGEIVIEAHARIGSGVRVVGPCRIARGAVIPAGSVVRGQPNNPSILRKENADGAAGWREGEVRDAPATAGVNGAAAKAIQSAEVSAPNSTRRVSALIASDFTANEMAGLLGTTEFDGLSFETEIAPFDQVIPTLLALKDRTQKPDVAIVWTRPDRTCPAFRSLLLGEQAEVQRIFAEIDAFAGVIKAQAAGARAILVPSWVLPPAHRGFGLLSLRDGLPANVLMRMNLHLAEALSGSTNVFLLDAQRWMAVARDGGYDAKLWLAGKVAFTTDVFSEAAKDIFAAVRGVLGMSRKLVVVDLDDTLWGGILGDVGWEGICLGGHDFNGEAFVDFQQRLLSLTKRGIALAIVSKNEESTALEAMRKHPEMLIRPQALSAFRINWRDKAQNIVEIVKELNLGLQSVVFIDDNPVERGRVREALPEVYVPEWPVDPTRYPEALDSLTCFDSAHISAEDLERNAMYATERERNALRSQLSTLDEWLGTLGLTVRFERLGRQNLARTTQLLNKTNQMNLRTRRMTEAELAEWSEQSGQEIWAVHVSDRFGDAGLTGILGLHREGEQVHVSDFVLSCRVMGRRVEETLLWAAKRRAAAMGGRQLIIEPIATTKNKPCLEFFAKLDGAKQGAGYLQPVDPADNPPALVTVTGLG